MVSLRAKLILTFIVVSVAGTLFSLLLIRSTTERALDDLVREQARDQFVAQLVSYYQQTGSWDGVETHYAVPQPGDPHTYLAERGAPFALADQAGLILISAGPYRSGQTVEEARLTQGKAVVVEGQTVGTVLTDTQPPRRGEAETRYIERTQQILLLGGVGATAMALLLGWLLARTLTRPLRELAEASRLLAGGTRPPLLPVRTRDELGALTSAFNQMSTELTRADDLRRQMTADIAHELRTPLTVLSGYIESMRDGTLKPTPPRLALMDQEIQTLRRLVDDLRTLSLAEAGELKLRREPTEADELLERLAASYSHAAGQKGVQLQVAAPAGLPLISADPERMAQVLANLVSNALRHTPAGGQIQLRAAPAGERVELAVQDTGPGIAPADLPYIFDRFYRADSARGDDEGGSGLGLAIAKALVEAHGGAILVDSTLGVGTTFRLQLPVA